jgi:hypothetical protein
VADYAVPKAIDNLLLLRRKLAAIVDRYLDVQQDIPTNFRRLWEFYRGVRKTWRKWLNRRTRGKTLPWHVYEDLLAAYPLQQPYIARPWAGAVSHV